MAFGLAPNGSRAMLLDEYDVILLLSSFPGNRAALWLVGMTDLSS